MDRLVRRDLGTLVVVFAAFGLLWFADRSTPDFLVTAPLPSKGPLREHAFPKPDVARVHSITAAPTADGGLVAMWFGGSREGARDVRLFGARMAPDGTWRAEAVDVNPRGRIGNPVLFRAAPDRLELYVVTVPFGGWSGAVVSRAVSADEGRTWGPLRRLRTAPIASKGTLVRHAPLPAKDGSVWLPLSRELGGRFAVLARIDRDGIVRERVKLTSGRSHFQPALVGFDRDRAAAYLRSAQTPDGKILRIEGPDAVELDLPSPDSGLAALHLGNGRVLLAYNDMGDSRHSLALAVDGTFVRHVERDSKPLPDGRMPEFSYPWLVQTTDGRLHLLYTRNRQGFRHVSFSEEWLR